MTVYDLDVDDEATQWLRDHLAEHGITVPTHELRVRIHPQQVRDPFTSAAVRRFSRAWVGDVHPTVPHSPEAA